MSALDDLNKLVVRTDIKLNQGEKCYFMSAGKLVLGVTQTTTTTSKPGIGVGVAVPVTKHFALGISRHKVKTETKVSTSINKVDCKFYLLDERAIVRVKNDISDIPYDSITNLTMKPDALTMMCGSKEVTVLMSKGDIARLQKVWAAIAAAKKEMPAKSQPVGRGNAPAQPVGNGAAVNGPQGDYAKTVFLQYLSYKPSAIKKREEYPSYLFYECGIQNGPQYHQDMINEGMLVPAPVEEIIKSYKVDQLKQILEDCGLDSSGKKDALIERIVANVPANNITMASDSPMYVISDKAKLFLLQHEDYIKLRTNTHYDIKWQEYDAAKAQNPQAQFLDICWGILNSRIQQNRGNIMADRNVYFSMYNILRDEGKKHDAMFMLIQVFFIDVNVDHLFAPGIIKALGENAEFFNPASVERVYGWGVKTNYTKEVFSTMLQEIFAGTFVETKYM